MSFHTPRHRYVPAPPAYPPAPTVPPAPPPAAGDELRRLRSAYKLLRRISTITALGYFVVFLLLAGYAPDVMGAHVGGTSFTLGTVMGLLQIPVTLLAVAGYERIARSTVDPASRRVRTAEREAAAGRPYVRERRR